MRNSANKSFLKLADLHTFDENVHQKRTQHGIQHPRTFVRYPILIDVPAETLTCITSYLDPPSLLAVAQVNTYLNHHVTDENTWRRAFICQFLGIGPQLDFDSKHAVLLRRSETSWRNEFIVRYRLRRRWERSRNGSISHIPVHSIVSGMHQMPFNGLLTSSLEYGIVARSTPLTGKILSGYLDASGSAAGLGIGNPNAEFTPNISACAMASDGGTAKLVWGSRVGDVLFMSIPKAMETGSRRSAAEVRRCGVVDEHEGAVMDATWLSVQPAWAVTGGADGKVKIWDAKTAASVWTSEQVLDSVIPDACIKVAGSAQHGFVVGVFKSGQIHIWTGFDFTQPVFLDDNVGEIIIECPIRTTTEGYESSATHDVTTIDHYSTADKISVLVGYENDVYFYRIHIDLEIQDVQTHAFGDPYSAWISTIASFSHAEKAESSIVFVGDHLGCISVYDWNADPHSVDSRTDAIGPLKKFEAHRDGASVTSIAWNGLVLVSGSGRGDAHVFDGMTFESLRSFESPHPRFRGRVLGTDFGEVERQRREREKVRIILLGPEKDVVFMGTGNKVVAWKAGPVPKYIRGGVRGRNVSSWARGKRQNLKQFDYLSQDIIDSQDIMEDEATFSARAQRARGREHDQRASLATLGLSEVEAVEYVLMLSRDEANERARHETSAVTGAVATSSRQVIDEGVFEGDFDSVPAPISSDSLMSSPSIVSSNSSGSSSSTSSGRESVTKSPITHGIGSGHPTPQATRLSRAASSHSSNSSSNNKIKISPPYRAEPLEAGMVWGEGEVQGTRLGLEDHYFPPIDNETTDGRTADSRPETPSLISDRKGHIGSAWSTPLTKKLSLSPSNTKGDKGADRHPLSSLRSSVPGMAPGPSRAPPTASRSQVDATFNSSVVDENEDGIDEDLRFALELSLAEAQSVDDVCT